MNLLEKKSHRELNPDEREKRDNLLILIGLIVFANLTYLGMRLEGSYVVTSCDLPAVVGGNIFGLAIALPYLHSYLEVVNKNK